MAKYNDNKQIHYIEKKITEGIQARKWPEVDQEQLFFSVYSYF